VQDLVESAMAAWRDEFPDMAEAEFLLVRRVARLHALLEEALLAQLGRFGMTRAEYDVLSTLCAAGKPYRLRPSDLTARILITSAGTTYVLRRLAAAGLIEREPDPEDARSSWVTLTAKGVGTTRAAVRAVTNSHVALLRPAAEPELRGASAALRGVLLQLGDVAPDSTFKLVRAPSTPSASEDETDADGPAATDRR
jgi:DNA-binding MarR family transcriptional regulator